jgi:TonB family protein
MNGRRRRQGAIKTGAVLITLVIHGGVIGGILVAHAMPHDPVIMPRDFMVAKIVRLGKKRDPKLLPTVPVQPVPTAPPPAAVKLTENETAAPASKTEKRPPDAKPGDLKSALAHSRALARLQAQADQEGDPNGDPSGNSNVAAAGDLYATALFKVYNEQWKIPQLAAAQGLSAMARIFVDAQGNVLKATLVKSSGNGPFDDSVSEVLQRVKKLPPPPAALALRLERSGTLLEFVPQ